MSNESRRKLLKSIAAGSGVIVAGKNLPESWVRPVVDIAILPVHAQTSGLSIYSSSSVTSASLDPQSDNKLTKIINNLVTEAHAGDVTPSILGCAKIDGALLEFAILDETGRPGGRYSGLLPLDKQTVCVNYDYCGGRGSFNSGEIEMKLVRITPDEVVIEVIGGIQYTIPEAQTCIDVPELECRR